MSGLQVAVIFATHRRATFLADLLAGLEAQDLGTDRFEVIAVDDASDDGTWEELQRLAAGTPLRLTTVRLDRNRGPAFARDDGVRRTTAPILVFTDDDCIPTPGWLSAVVEAFAADPDVDLVQGRTEGRPSELPGQTRWDHVVWVLGPTPWFETCNIAYRRAAYERAGRFDVDDPVLNPGAGSHFGEDVDLGARVLAGGGRRGFAERAVVHHRVLPRDYRGWLRAQRRLGDFPSLARRSAVVRESTWLGVFLNRSTASFDLAAAGAALAVVRRRSWWLLLAAPWARRRWVESRDWANGDRVVAAGLLARLALGDAVGAAAMARGSLRHRKLLL